MLQDGAREFPFEEIRPELAERVEEVTVLGAEVAWTGITEVVGDLLPCLARRKRW
jgi:hypothetical protein